MGEFVDEMTVIVGAYMLSDRGDIKDASLTPQVWTRGRVEQVVFRWFEVTEPFGEHRECPVDCRVHNDLFVHHSCIGLRHGFSSVVFPVVSAAMSV